MTHHKYLAPLAVLFGVTLAAIGSGVASAAGNPFVGTFVMNAAKSTADAGPLPQSSTVTTEELDDGKFKTTVDAVLEDGTREHWETTYARDGKDYPASGNPSFNTVAVKLSDPNTIEVVEKKDGTVVSTITGKASADGKTITSTISGTNPEGEPVTSTIFSERQ